MKIKKNSKHFWFFCCIVTEDEIITCKSDFVSSLCVYYLRAALEVLLIISVQLDGGKECHCKEDDYEAMMKIVSPQIMKYLAPSLKSNNYHNYPRITTT